MNILRKLDRGLTKLEEGILSFSILLMAVMLIGNVLSRQIFGPSWLFASEINKYAVVLTTFMGITYAARKGRHIRMSALFDVVPHKVKKAMIIIVSLVTALSLFYLAKISLDYLYFLYEQGKVTVSLKIPVYIMMCYVPIGLILGGLQYLRNLWINIREKEVYIATEKVDHSETIDMNPQL